MRDGTSSRASSSRKWGASRKPATPAPGRSPSIPTCPRPTATACTCACVSATGRGSTARSRRPSSACAPASRRPTRSRSSPHPRPSPTACSARSPSCSTAFRPWHGRRPRRGRRMTGCAWRTCRPTSRTMRPRTSSRRSSSGTTARASRSPRFPTAPPRRTPGAGGSRAQWSGSSTSPCRPTTRSRGRLRDLGIDIAVDLKGFTTGCRTGILARRPAPVQVNYLGYPGIDGRTLHRLPHRRFHGRRRRARGVLQRDASRSCPDSYQAEPLGARDRRSTPSRAELGLPEGALVFCCFNNNYKITPEVFRRRGCGSSPPFPAACCGCSEGHPAAAANLRPRGPRPSASAPERLVFAPRVDTAQHLARHAAADLFLDTFPCNAHTTASDALWAGLPVVTVLGDAFPGRVAASLLRAVGLPELVANSLPEYEALARRLAARAGGARETAGAPRGQPDGPPAVRHAGLHAAPRSRLRDDGGTARARRGARVLRGPA